MKPGVLVAVIEAVVNKRGHINEVLRWLHESAVYIGGKRGQQVRRVQIVSRGHGAVTNISVQIVHVIRATTATVVQLQRMRNGRHVGQIKFDGDG